MTEKRLKELEAFIRDARREIYDAEDVDRIARNKDCVGKFYMCQNRYSSDESWPLYLAITGMGETGELQGWTFEHTSIDRIEFDHTRYQKSPKDSGMAWKEISAERFQNAFNKLIALLKRRMTVAMK